MSCHVRRNSRRHPRCRRTWNASFVGTRSREILLARLRSKLRSPVECASKAALGIENTQTQKAEGVRHFPLRKIPGLFSFAIFELSSRRIQDMLSRRIGYVPPQDFGRS
jgi:hypothetical protein